jgi:hypothetical protein
MNTAEVVAYIVVIISSSIWSLGDQGKCPNSISMWHKGSLSTTSDMHHVDSLLHLICIMLTDMGGNWGFEGQCCGNSIKTCQYSLSRFDGFCGLIFVAPLVSLSPTWMLSRMLIGDLSSTPE